MCFSQEIISFPMGFYEPTWKALNINNSSGYVSDVRDNNANNTIFFTSITPQVCTQICHTLVLIDEELLQLNTTVRG
jgi:hypothetical protein